MIRFINSFLVMLLIASAAHAQQSPQLLFDKANTLLENNDYMDAMNMYRQIADGDQVSGALYLNMGIASTQLDSLGLAKYYFLKAAGFETTKSSAIEALQYVESQFSRQSATLPKLPWDRAVDWMKTVPGSDGVFLFGFIFIFIAVSILLIHWAGFFSFTKLRRTFSSLSISGILILVLAFYVDYVDQRYSEAVIITNEIQVKQQADETADLVSLGYVGYSITIDHNQSSESTDWIYIRLGNGQFGWIKNSGIKIL